MLYQLPTINTATLMFEIGHQKSIVCQGGTHILNLQFKKKIYIYI